ncbi:hypothetical protein CKM354_000001800 [Cercospora kikuchii]|uniref:DJ-1/PfpI domain-containing protein n=1 Tax=Cercospora kikuchii TaxID=84275 RepID=A0A9P3C856_9PEZI|nr:uncharacterized protein CKM354_000001800 [Cercospora kikuchii]GIZ36547.1 hypothetical protein CKM354_000001800 [Cercospora kikuchii]
MPPHPPLQVLFLAFQQINILDLTGPCEIFALGKAKLTIAASNEIITTFEGMSLRRDRSLTSLLETNHDGSHSTSTLPPLDSFDILVIPGSLLTATLAAIKDDPDICKVISRWSELDRSATSPNGWNNKKPLLTICGGALFAGSIGLLGGKTCTMHYLDNKALQEICVKAGEKANVVRKRVVDSGETKSGMRILTSGGVTCGIDASLWLVSQMVDLDTARGIARIIDYKWELDSEWQVTEGMIV